MEGGEISLSFYTMKLITWDINGTIIKPNPEFKHVKYDLTRDYFNLKFNDNYIGDAFRQLNARMGALSETYGVHIDQVTCFAALLYELGIETDLYTIRDFITAYEEKYLEYYPSFYDENTLSTLTRIAEEYDNVAISNLSFISAPVMDKLLYKILRIPKHVISNTVYSGGPDLIAKPDSRIYFKHAQYHVGDNLYTDKFGPEKVGVKGFIINSNDKTIIDFQNHLLKNKQINNEKEIPV